MRKKLSPDNVCVLCRIDLTGRGCSHIVAAKRAKVKVKQAYRVCRDCELELNRRYHRWEIVRKRSVTPWKKRLAGGEFHLVLSYDELGRLFGIEYVSDTEMALSHAAQHTEDFVPMYESHAGIVLTDDERSGMWKWFYDAAIHELDPNVVLRRFFEKHYSYYENTVSDLARLGQWHAPDEILTRRPKPHNHYGIARHHLLAREIEIHLYSGVENAYLESRYGLGLNVVRRLAEDSRKWGPADFADLVRTVGAFTGAYDVEADWDRFFEAYEPRWPTFEQAVIKMGELIAA